MLLLMVKACADPEVGGGGVWQGVRTTPPPEQSQTFSGNTGSDPLKNRSYQASIQCRVTIGTQPKRHLMAIRWRTNEGPLITVLGFSLPSSTQKKNVVKVGPPLIKLSGSAHGKS